MLWQSVFLIGQDSGMADERAGFVKLHLRLEPDEDGYPPGSEGLWAVPPGGDTYRLDNTVVCPERCCG